MTLGFSDTGSPVTLDLARAPHVLVAGMTGSGKSVIVNQVITQLIERYTDDQVAFLFFDPKRVELSRYKNIKHAYAPPIYDTGFSVSMLAWAVEEMENRFVKMERYGHQDIDARNAHNDEQYPHCVIVIDELANLVLSDKRVEPLIVKLASMGRAAGIHLVVATQRPSADVVTGLIKANIPTRVCLPVMSQMESRIILDEIGGERLTKPGEMLIRLPGQRGLVHAYGQMLDVNEINRIVRRAA